MPAIDPMSPDASPGRVPGKTGVRRVNNMPLFLVLAALAVFLIVMLLVASDRAAKQHETTKPVEKGGDSSRAAQDIIGDRQGGMVKARPLAVPSMPGGTAVAVANPNLDAPPAPPGMAPPPPRDENVERIRQAKLERLEEAARAKTSVQMVAPRSSGSPTGAGARKTTSS